MGGTPKYICGGRGRVGFAKRGFYKQLFVSVSLDIVQNQSTIRTVGRANKQSLSYT